MQNQMGKIDFLKIVPDHPEWVRMGLGSVPDMFWTILSHFGNADVCKITVWADFKGRFSRYLAAWIPRKSPFKIGLYSDFTDIGISKMAQNGPKHVRNTSRTHPDQFWVLWNDFQKIDFWGHFQPPRGVSTHPPTRQKNF